MIIIFSFFRTLGLQQSRLDSDNESYIDNGKFKVLTWFFRPEFYDSWSSVTAINSSRYRSKRTCLAIIVMKPRSAYFCFFFIWTISNKGCIIVLKMYFLHFALLFIFNMERKYFLLNVIFRKYLLTADVTSNQILDLEKIKFCICV